MNTLQENITKAAQCSDLLVADIRAAYLATEGEPFAEIILMDLSIQAVVLNQKLTRLANL